jgi:glutathione S-transferase
MSPQLTLYTFKLSLWAGVPRLAVHELETPNVKLVEVDLSKAENFSPEFLKINPNHTVPALEIDDNGSKQYLDDTTSVVNYLNQLADNKLTIVDKQAEIDAFLKHMHEEGDVGNPLFFTAGSPEELEAKKAIVPPFLQGRIKGWETYLEQAPEHAELYNKNINETKGLLASYTGGNAEVMFAINKKLWEAGSKFLDSAEALLKQYEGDYLFGAYSIADVHFTPYLFRTLLVRQPDQVFADRPLLKAYYERIQARPSFKKTFE